MTTKQIDLETAEGMVRKTARLNQSGRLGTPFGSNDGYALDAVLAIIRDRATGLRTGTMYNLPVLWADTAHGYHVWYLRTEAPPTSPWSA
jgi:hypothetical protein